MTATILALEDVGRNDVAIAGGKGANLGELVRKRFPVPPGFVVSARACEMFFRSMELEKAIGGLAGASAQDMDHGCRRIRQAIGEAPMPPDLSRAIAGAHNALAARRGADMICAVRSSATAEDLGDASFAGQHATYYYVDRDSLLKMVKNCWASLWNAEAVSYRTTQGIDHGSVFMAVVVQEMIASEISGVTFTANPVTGDRDEIVTESSWGMGAAIVDGRVTPDHYIIHRDGLRLTEKRIADKRFMVPPRLDTAATGRLREVPHNMRRKETLSLDQARQVARWAMRAEDHFGTPQDMEWAMADGQFYMLQSRPITVMGHKEIGRDVHGQYVVFKPLVENFTDPLTPLSIDSLNRCGVLGTRFIGGRAYMDLRPLRAILPFKASDEQLANLLYALGANPPKLRLSLLKLPFCLICFGLLYLLYGVFYARTRRLPDDFMDRYRNLCRQVENDPAMGPLDTMWRLWSWYWARFFEPAGQMVILVNLSATRYMFFMGMLQKILRRWIPDIRQDAESLLCSGAEGVLSADMGRGIWELAREAKRSEAVRRLLETNKPDHVLSRLEAEPTANKFLKRLDRFLAQNGHRAIKELELQSVRWEENPAPVLGMVRNYLLVETDPDEHEKKVALARKALQGEIRQTLARRPLEALLGWRWRLIRYLAGRTRHFAKMRENSRFYHIMGMHIVRKKILAIEKTCMAQGKLRCRDDIFYLHHDEINQLQAGHLAWRDVEDRIRDRRMETIRLSKMVPPKTVGIDITAPPKIKIPAGEAENALRGQPASPGSYEGLAHVILDPSIDIELKPGEILVAPYTDPAWTPLFLTAGAAVVEVGSYLSHAGTVAREFGMPCVVDLPECTRHIHTGAGVRVDGDSGVVQIIPGKGEATS